MSELSTDSVCVLVVGGGLSGCAVALSLAAMGSFEVHIYEQSQEGGSSSSEVVVPLTEELQAFCKQHGLDPVSVTSARC